MTQTTKLIVTTSWDDGSVTDLKLAELLKKYSVPATFYVSITNRIHKCLSPSQMRKIARDFDVGGHTFSHVKLARIPLVQAEEEITRCRKELETIVGREVKAFCYPWGSYNRQIIELVKKAGFAGARTTRCFRTRINDPYQMGTTLHTHDHSPLLYVRELIRGNSWDLLSFLVRRRLLGGDWRQIAIGTLEYLAPTGGVWHLWGHSWDIERRNDWERLEDVFREIQDAAATRSIVLMDNTQLMLKLQTKHTNGLPSDRSLRRLADSAPLGIN